MSSRSDARSAARRSSEELAEQLAVVLDETLDDLRAEPDPRRAIIAAYARLERVLAANGVPRRAAETSDEYLPRVLHDLALDSGAVERLTALFTRAKFSQHEVDTAMKEEAIDALEQVRDELRLAAGDARSRQPARRRLSEGELVRRDVLACRACARRCPRSRSSGSSSSRPAGSSSAVRIYALVLCAAVIVVLLLALRRAYPDETALREPATRAPSDERRHPSLARLEHETALGVAGSFDLHYRLVPRLRALAAGLLELAAERLARGSPDTARALLGEEAWELVRPIAPRPRTASRRASLRASSATSSTRWRPSDGASAGPGALRPGARRGREGGRRQARARSSSSCSASSRTGTSCSRTTRASRRRSPRARSRRC